MSESIHIRNIEPTDNVAIAAVIRAALTEFGANKPGTVYLIQLPTTYMNYLKSLVLSIM